MCEFLQHEKIYFQLYLVILKDVELKLFFKMITVQYVNRMLIFCPKI